MGKRSNELPYVQSEPRVSLISIWIIRKVKYEKVRFPQYQDLAGLLMCMRIPAYLSGNKIFNSCLKFRNLGGPRDKNWIQPAFFINRIV